MNTLRQRILAIVDENSGGVKMMQLVAELCTQMLEAEEPISDDLLYLIENKVNLCPELEMLEYRMTMGRHEQVKQFIYRPLEEK